MNLSKEYNTSQILRLSKVNLAFDLKKMNSVSLKDSFINLTRSVWWSNLFSRNDMFHCLKDVTIAIQEGDRIGLVGKNGAGKTTLCHIIAGNFTPTSGTVSRFCKIRCLFNSNPQIFPELSGKENARIVARLLYPDFPESSIVNIVNESIGFAELEKFKDVAIKNYSKGMSARLFLSLMTAIPTDLLILDEVFDGADEFFMQKFSTRLENIISQSKAVIFINHDSKILERYVNRVIVLKNGEILFDGNPVKGFFAYQNHID